MLQYFLYSSEFLSTKLSSPPKKSTIWWNRFTIRLDILSNRATSTRRKPGKNRSVTFIGVYQYQKEHVVETMIHSRQGYDIQTPLSSTSLWNHYNQATETLQSERELTAQQQKFQQRTQRLVHDVLAIAEALVQSPMDQEHEQGHEQQGRGTAEQLLMALICSVLNCHYASLIAIDPITERLHLVAGTHQDLAYQADWEQIIHQRHLSEYLSPLVLAQLRVGEVVFNDAVDTIVFPLPGVGHSTSLAPVLVEKHLIGMLILTHEGQKQGYSQEERTTIEQLGRLAAQVLERERLLLKRIETQAGEIVLRHTLQKMDESISMVSHELKTPLTAIRMSTQLAQNRLRRFTSQVHEGTTRDEYGKMLEEIQEVLGRIDTQVRIQNRLVDDLLDLPRLQVNQLSMDMQLHDLSAILQDVVEVQKNTTPSHHITLSINTEDPVLAIFDSDRIRQVINNYLTNAFKYSPEGCSIRVFLEVQGKEARVAISDEGPGLSTYQQEQIWKRYYQAPGIKVQCGNNKGLGLGLHICRIIIEQHQGKVGVESIPGMGATFWFSLPLPE